MLGADTCVCSTTRVRLRDLEPYGVGDIMATGRCKGVLLRGGGGGAAKLGGRICDVVVTPCDVRSLEIQRPPVKPLLMLCLG